jgi:hypothetical protein
MVSPAAFVTDTPDAPNNIYAGPGYTGSSEPPPPPDDGQIEAMKERMSSLESKLDRIDDRLRGVEIKLGEIGGKLELIAAKLPSWWQAPVSAASLVTLLVAVMVLAKHFKLIAP